MFKTIDSLLEFTNETKFKRLFRKQHTTQQQPENCPNERRKDESAFCTVNCVKNNGPWREQEWGRGEERREIDATYNEIPVNRPESLWDVCVCVIFCWTNEQNQNWKWSTHFRDCDFSFLKTSFHSSFSGKCLWWSRTTT